MSFAAIVFSVLSTAISGQWSALSRQPSAVSRQPKATLREWLTLRKQLSVTQHYSNAYLLS
ncbi:hypothetical protein [Moorena sp. SIO3H5]|uniref:hypothetical protein n=1 Tax=Moorena sp. SIO3H5 TaxID=2607834 RepID=UPI0013BE8450|nr:hypothetical protein [Moorena sp. SIO3H5]NEO71418.1 hypothetical protein [Moorena sp. SIO3H5]